MKTSLVLLGAGKSTRFGLKNIKKQWIRVGDDPLFIYVYKQFIQIHDFIDIIITVDEIDFEYVKSNYGDYNITFVKGSDTRQNSIKNAIENITSEYVLISDIARCNIDTIVVQNILSYTNKNIDCVVPYLTVNDTVVFQDKTIDRNQIKLIQTPQLSCTKTLKKATATNKEYTDDRGAISQISQNIEYVNGSEISLKLTTKRDLKKLNLDHPNNKVFVGHGYDIHRTKEGSEIILGGIKIPASFALLAHSDGDVLIHSVIDALLGSIGASDIGELFPDTDNKYKNIDSTELLKLVIDFFYSVGYKINNIDISVLAQSPKLKRYKNQIKQNLAKLLSVKLNSINIKATTHEKLDAIGENRAIAVHSIVSVSFFDWQNAKN